MIDYKQTKNLDNFFKAALYSDNEWGVPYIQPFTDDISGIEWFSFGEKANIKNPENSGIHFYIDDYKFDSIWKQPDRWLNLFRKCKAVVTPDFSCYTDMPKAQQLWNHYRRQWLGAYWQENGVNVIASLSWANGQLYDWSLAGIPQNTICATSFVGYGIDVELSVEELKTAIEKLKPETECKRNCKGLSANTYNLISIRGYKMPKGSSGRTESTRTGLVLYVPEGKLKDAMAQKDIKDIDIKYYVIGNTYEIREQLKQEGAVYDPELKGWYFKSDSETDRDVRPAYFTDGSPAAAAVALQHFTKNYSTSEILRRKREL